MSLFITFIDGEIREKKYHVSSHFPFEGYSFFNKLPEDNYILCPDYGVDVQIGITGTCEDFGYEESFFETFSRELEEELGLFFIDKNLIDSKIKNKYGLFSVDIKNLEIREFNEYKEEGKKLNKKIMAFVYGTYSDIIDYLKKININPTNPDKIKNVVAIKISDAKKIISSLTSSGLYSPARSSPYEKINTEKTDVQFKIKKDNDKIDIIISDFFIKNVKLNEYILNENFKLFSSEEVEFLKNDNNLFYLSRGGRNFSIFVFYPFVKNEKYPSLIAKSTFSVIDIKMFDGITKKEIIERSKKLNFVFVNICKDFIIFSRVIIKGLVYIKSNNVEFFVNI